MVGGVSKFGAAFRAAEARGVTVQGQRWALAAACDVGEDGPGFDRELLAIRVAIDTHEARPAGGVPLLKELRTLLLTHPAADLWTAVITGSRHLLRRDAEETWTMHRRHLGGALKRS